MRLKKNSNILKSSYPIRLRSHCFSHTLSSKQLSSYQIPIVAIEREAEYISSVTTDNYMGALQATTLLIRDKCDILIHINVNVEKAVPAYDRIRAFKETCEEYQVPYDIDLSVSGNSYQEILNEIRRIFTRIEEKYPNQKKGNFPCQRYLCKHVS